MRAAIGGGIGPSAAATAVERGEMIMGRAAALHPDCRPGDGAMALRRPTEPLDLPPIEDVGPVHAGARLLAADIAAQEA